MVVVATRPQTPLGQNLTGKCRGSCRSGGGGEAVTAAKASTMISLKHAGGVCGCLVCRVGAAALAAIPSIARSLTWPHGSFGPRLARFAAIMQTSVSALAFNDSSFESFTRSSLHSVIPSFRLHHFLYQVAALVLISSGKPSRQR